LSSVAEFIARAQAAQRAGQLQAACEHYQQALRLDANCAQAHEELGNLLARAGQPDQAAQCLRRATQLNPRSLAAFGNLGNLLRYLGQLDEAASCYRRVLELQPASALAHNDLGLIAQAQGRLDEAVANFSRAIELDAAFVEAHTNLATALAQAGRLDAAVPVFRRATELRPDSSDAHYNLATALANLGEWDTAAACCRRAISLKPDAAPAWFVLGFSLMRLGRLDEAAAHLRRAIELRPDHAEAHNSLALVLRNQNQLEQAADCCRRAIELKPGFAEAHNILGTVLAAQGRMADAVVSYRQALERKPHDPEMHLNLGLALAAQDQLDDAVACYRRALDLRPDYAEAHSNLALALVRQENLDEGIAGYRRAIQLQPNFAEAHNNLAVALVAHGQPEEAIASYRRALQLRPDLAEAHYTLSGLLARQGDLEEAADSCCRACELKPQMAEAHHALGAILAKLGNAAEARQCYLRAIALKPDEVAWRLNLISLCPPVFGSNAEIDAYRQNLLSELDGFTRDDVKLDLSTLVKADCRPAFNLQFHGRYDRPVREAFARVFSHSPPGKCGPPNPGRSRLGFVVTDRHESIFLKSMAGVLERMDSARFEVVVVGSARGTALLRPELRNPTIRLVALPDSIDRAAETIRQERFDLLYYWEVATDSTNYFLPFLRLAPVQCTSWGIQVTSGIPQLDYYLSSELVEPADAQQHYSERLVLASTLLTYQRRLAPPAAPKPREHFGFSSAQHLYLCAQQLGKFQPDFDPILSEILRRDPRGVIVIAEERHGRFPGNALRQRFATTMPEVARRIVFLPFQPADDYLSLIATADVLLDPLHFGGVNSTYDALSLNQPIVTLPSTLHRGRYTLGCYRKMGLTDCIANSPAQYVEIALRLAHDLDFRASVVAAIRDASPLLFDDPVAVSEHERIFNMLIDKARDR
jgi:tetratricopeptide (TPR) repeat protein